MAQKDLLFPTLPATPDMASVACRPGCLVVVASTSRQGELLRLLTRWDGVELDDDLGAADLKQDCGDRNVRGCRSSRSTSNKVMT